MRSTNYPPARRSLLVAIAALSLAPLGCTDGPAMLTAPDVAPSAASGIGEHGGGRPGSIAFGSRRDGGPPEIWLMNADGSDPVQLTSSPGATAANGQPDWSPSGQSIAFMSTRTGNAEIFVTSSDGSRQLNLTSHPATDEAPVWSPDGQQVAFHSNRDGNFELYVLHLRTEELTRLTVHSGVDRFPDWSPNGREIAFQRDGDIHVLDIATGEVTRLTSTPAMEDMPAWSPDGQRIAFMSQRDGYPSVYVMNADGSDPVNLTARPAGVTGGWTSLWPSWSRNGQELYFQGTRPESAADVEIFVIDAGGGSATRLTNAPGVDSAPVAR